MEKKDNIKDKTHTEKFVCDISQKQPNNLSDDGKIVPPRAFLLDRKLKPHTESIHERQLKPHTQSVHERRLKPQTERVRERQLKPLNESVHERQLKPQTERVHERQLKSHTESIQERRLKPQTERVRERQLKPHTESVHKRQLKPQNERVRERQLKPHTESVHERKLKPQNERVRERQLKPHTESVHERQLKPQNERVRERQLKPPTISVRKRQLKPHTERIRERQLKPHTESVHERQLKPHAESVHERKLKPPTESVHERKLMPQTDNVRDAVCIEKHASCEVNRLQPFLSKSFLEENTRNGRHAVTYLHGTENEEVSHLKHDTSVGKNKFWQETDKFNDKVVDSRIPYRSSDNFQDPFSSTLSCFFRDKRDSAKKTLSLVHDISHHDSLSQTYSKISPKTSVQKRNSYFSKDFDSEDQVGTVTKEIDTESPYQTKCPTFRSQMNSDVHESGDSTDLHSFRTLAYSGEKCFMAQEREVKVGMWSVAQRRELAGLTKMYYEAKEEEIKRSGEMLTVTQEEEYSCGIEIYSVAEQLEPSYTIEMYSVTEALELSYATKMFFVGEELEPLYTTELCSVAEELEPSYTTELCSVAEELEPSYTTELCSVTEALELSYATEMFFVGEELEPLYTTELCSVAEDLEPSYTTELCSVAEELEPSYTTELCSVAEELEPSYTTELCSVAEELEPSYTTELCSVGEELEPSYTTELCSVAEELEPSYTTELCSVTEALELSYATEMFFVGEELEPLYTTELCSVAEELEPSYTTELCSVAEELEPSYTTELCSVGEELEPSYTTELCSVAEELELSCASEMCSVAEKQELANAIEMCSVAPISAYRSLSGACDSKENGCLYHRHYKDKLAPEEASALDMSWIIESNRSLPGAHCVAYPVFKETCDLVPEDQPPSLCALPVPVQESGAGQEAGHSVEYPRWEPDNSNVDERVATVHDNLTASLLLLPAISPPLEESSSNLSKELHVPDEEREAVNEQSSSDTYFLRESREFSGLSLSQRPVRATPPCQRCVEKKQAHRRQVPGRDTLNPSNVDLFSSLHKREVACRPVQEQHLDSCHADGPNPRHAWTPNSRHVRGLSSRPLRDVSPRHLRDVSPRPLREVTSSRSRDLSPVQHQLPPGRLTPDPVLGHPCRVFHCVTVSPQTPAPRRLEIPRAVDLSSSDARASRTSGIPEDIDLLLLRILGPHVRIRPGFSVRRRQDDEDAVLSGPGISSSLHVGPGVQREEPWDVDLMSLRILTGLAHLRPGVSIQPEDPSSASFFDHVVDLRSEDNRRFTHLRLIGSNHGAGEREDEQTETSEAEGSQGSP